MAGKKVFIYSNDRETLDCVFVKNLGELLKIGANKLDYKTPATKIVREDTGHEINNDEDLMCLDSATKLVLLKENEEWIDQSSTHASPGASRVEEEVGDTVLSRTNTDNDSIFSLDNFLDNYKNILNKILKALEKYSVENNFFKSWKAKAVSMLSDADSYNPNIEFALAGDAGVGKSSFLNAILDHDKILPTSDGKACTSAVVIISGNDSGTNKYEADVEFLNEEELFRLVDWFRQITVSRPKDIDPDIDKERKAYSDIVKSDRHKEYLGKNKHIQKDSENEFAKEVKCFIEATEDGLWRIVKQVFIRIPNCKIFSNKVRFVDLPGIQDSNPVRQKIVKEYLKNCRGLWILADLQRASTNKTVGDLFKGDCSEVQYDGKLNSVALVCTKTDIFDCPLVDEIEVEKLKLKTEKDKCSSEKKDLADKIKGNKITPDGKTQAGKQLEIKKKELKAIKSELANIELKEKTERKNYAVERIENCKKDLHLAYDELFRKLSAKELINIICVSSREYTKLKKNPELGKVFDDIADTEIPKFINYCQNKSFNWLCVELEQLVSPIARFVCTIWNRLSGPGVNEKEHKEISRKLSKQTRAFLESCDKLVNQYITKDIFKALQGDIEKGVNQAIERCDEIISVVETNIGNRWQTWKAIMSREGSYYKSKDSKYDYNEALAEPILSAILESLHNTFQRLVMEAVNKYEEGIFKELAGLHQRISGAAEQSRLDGVKEQVNDMTKLMLEGMKNDIEEHASKKQQEFHRKIVPKIREKMNAAYKKYADDEQQGKGAIKRMKGIIHDYVRDTKSEMFKSVQTMLSEDIDKLVETKKQGSGFKAKLFQFSKKLSDEIREVYQSKLDVPILVGDEIRDDIQNLCQEIFVLFQQIKVKTIPPTFLHLVADEASHSHQSASSSSNAKKSAATKRQTRKRKGSSSPRKRPPKKLDER